nr:uncharacterized protein LOC129447577 isoform X3 [Misgurnus anguillicaudatus]
MITLHARGWNERKKRNPHKYFSTRYLKTIQKTKEFKEDIEAIKKCVQRSDDELQQWVTDVRQWAVDTPDDLRTDDPVALQHLIEGLFLGIQQKKRDLYRVTESDTSLAMKKKVFDKVMQLERLIEEEAILVEEMKQHWTLDLTRTYRALKNQASVLSEDLATQSYPSGLSVQAYHGLHSAVLQRLEELKTDLVAVKETYVTRHGNQGHKSAAQVSRK